MRSFVSRNAIRGQENSSRKVSRNKNRSAVSKVFLYGTKGSKRLSLRGVLPVAPVPRNLMRCRQGCRLRCTEIRVSPRLAVGSVESTQ